MHIGRDNIERIYKLASVNGIRDLAECDLGVSFQFNLQFDIHVAITCTTYQ